MMKITEEQVETIKKNYYEILQADLLNDNTDLTREKYKMYLLGFASAIGVECEQLDETLDNYMLSDHFVKQQLNFNSEEELFELTQKQLG